MDKTVGVYHVIHAYYLHTNARYCDLTIHLSLDWYRN